eukprot:SAG11_NODE_1848_length_4170_cov_1.679931_2_plen_421_part_00
MMTAMKPFLFMSLLQLAHGTINSIEISTWEFQTDPDDVGVAERWFSTQARPTLERTIRSPGAWQAQGVGNETALEFHQYEGVGWYRQTLTPPTIPESGSAWLWIGGAPGGVMRSANVWANGAHCGRHVGFLEPLEIDLTPAIGSDGSKLELAVAVDSRWNRTEDPLWGGGSMWNSGGPGSGGGAGAHVPAATASGGDGYSFGGFGGMIGHAKLLVRERAWFEDSVHVACKGGEDKSGAWHCDVQLSLLGKVNAADRVSLKICERGSGGACTSAIEGLAKSTRMTLTATIAHAKLWAPGTPAAQANLYVANLTLRGSDLAAEASRRFGVRSLSTDGPRILFNGEPLFLRGYGDDAQYGFTGAVSQPLLGTLNNGTLLTPHIRRSDRFSFQPPMEKSYYLDQLSDMKKLGYNFIRFREYSCS